MQTRTTVMPSIFSFVLFVVVATTTARADTPFSWDDFERESLEGGDVHWEVSFGEAYLEDESLMLQPEDAGKGEAFARIPPVGDFSIRTQISFGGAQNLGGEPWFGLWFTNAPAPGSPGTIYWGGVLPDGNVNIGSATVLDSEFVLEPGETYERDIHLQFDAIGDGIAFSAWFDGTEKPAEPQVTTDWERFAPTAVGLTYNTQLTSGDHLGTVRHFAVLPAVTGDFSASDSLDEEDINLIDQELRGQSKNRVFDLNDDVLVTSEDRRILIQDLLGTWYGDSNLDGEFNSSDLVTVFQASEYEDAIQRNSSWASGDWNGNGDFDSADLVLAFQDGGFEQGPKSAVNAVPEPTSLVMLIAGTLGIGTLRRREHR